MYTRNRVKTSFIGKNTCFCEDIAIAHSLPEGAIRKDSPFRAIAVGGGGRLFLPIFSTNKHGSLRKKAGSLNADAGKLMHIVRGFDIIKVTVPHEFSIPN